MVLFWCRTKQAQLRALSNQFKRCYSQIHGSSSAIQGTRTGVLNSQSLTFHKTGPYLDNHVRFFAAPVQAPPVLSSLMSKKDQEWKIACTQQCPSVYAITSW